MKLYFSPVACSLSPHIVAREAGIDIALERVEKNHVTSTGADFWAINPKGYVPALLLEDGELLTEGPAIVLYLADQKPESKLAPACGTRERYRLQSMLGFINSEIHKGWSPLFKPDLPAETRAAVLALLKKRYAIIEKELANRDYLFGDFTVADAYLFTVTNWARFTKVDMSEFPNIVAYQARVAARPAVRAAIDAEKRFKG